MYFFKLFLCICKGDDPSVKVSMTNCSFVHFVFVSAVGSDKSVFVRSCSDEHEQDGFICRYACHDFWICLTNLSDEFVYRCVYHVCRDCLTGFDQFVSVQQHHYRGWLMGAHVQVHQGDGRTCWWTLQP